MNETIQLITGLGPTGLLAAGMLYLWRELERAREALAAVRAEQLMDARSNTTKMLELYEKLHPIDDDRRSRHD